MAGGESGITVAAGAAAPAPEDSSAFCTASAKVFSKFSESDTEVKFSPYKSPEVVSSHCPKVSEGL